jgi:hypothetical protein
MPMDRSRYPDNWRELSIAIRLRALGRCECAGECAGHSGSCGAVNHEAHPETGSRVVLTVAHLWRGPCAEHNSRGFKCGEPAHLKAMCQACHLRYDAPQHRLNRQRNRFQLRAVSDLFDPMMPPE